MTSRRNWSGKRSYQSALDHITLKRKSQPSIYISTNVKLVRGPNDEYIYVTERWAREEHAHIIFYKDGRTELKDVGGYIGTNNIMNWYSPLRNGSWMLQGLSKCRFLNKAERTPEKQVKCRECHGYLWQGDKIENILHELGCHEPECKEWYGACDTLEHRRRCYRCYGTSKMTIGGNPVEYPVIQGSNVFVSPEGVPAIEGVLRRQAQDA